MGEPEIRVLSWGLGLCSTTMAVMSAEGDLPPVDLVLNCDPGWERPLTYEMREFYTDWLRGKGVTVKYVQTGNIREEPFKHRGFVPFWTESGAPLTRQCTTLYKREPCKRMSREAAGYDARKAPHPPAGAIEMWLGFTIEEWHRMKAGRVKFLHHEHPLVRHKITRAQCKDYLADRGLPIPCRSACVCCPFRKASDWLEIRETEPETWEAAVEFDRSIRDGSQTLKGSSAGELFLFKGPTLREPEPLEDAPLEAYAARERKLEWFQLPLLCGDGGCWT